MKVFEKGGAMYTGKIVQTYHQGQEIDVKVMVNQSIWDEKICNWFDIC